MSLHGVVHQTHIPSPLTSLVGRTYETEAICLRLRDRNVRLVTLTGPGGVGKTRLAIHVANQVAADFADGVIFVDLSPVTDPDRIPATIAHYLDLPGSGQFQLIERIAAYLRGRRLLLVLDNLEQVIGCAPALAELLSLAPSITILATSRELLRLSGEFEFPVPPLALSKPDEQDLEILGGHDAVRLFLQRAESAHNGFTLTSSNAPAIAALCARLDGLPLAIELAAARLRHLSPQALLARLNGNLTLLTGGARDLPARLQTMRDAIAWSHDLLTEPEQIVFRRLSVFAGGFSPEAAERVAGHLGDDAESEATWVFDLISSLVDKNLIHVRTGVESDARFGMLETIREYGLDRQSASDDRLDIRGRHADWCIEFVEQAAAGLTGPDRLLHARRVALELPNLRQALEWAIQRGDADRALRVVAAISPFWEMQGHLIEGDGWSCRSLDLPGAANSKYLGAAHRGASTFAYRTGNYEVAVEEAQAARAFGETTGDIELVSGAFINLGCVAYDRGDLEGSLDHFEQALIGFREIDHHDGIADSLSKIGLVLTGLGQLDCAAEALEESAALGRKLNRPIWVATSLGRLAFVDQLRGDLDLAERRITEALSTQRELNPFSAVAMLWMAGTIARDRREYQLAAARYRESLDSRWKWGERRGVAESLSGIAELAVLTNNPESAAILFGGVAALRQEIGVPGYRWEQHRRDQALARARTELGISDFNSGYETGKVTALSAIVALATTVAHDIEHTDQSRKIQVPAARTIETNLTSRELDVLRSLADGLTDREIGDALYISPRTVARHLHSVYQKLDVPSRSAATAFAHRHGIV